MRILGIGLTLGLMASTVTAGTCLAADGGTGTPADSGNFLGDQSTMIKVVSTDESPKIKSGTFAALPKTLWRSGTKYLRIEELPDSAKDIHGLMITSGPKNWMINLMDRTGQLSEIPSGWSSTTQCPVFADGEKDGPKDLEFGNELAYFRRLGAKQLPDDTIGGAICSAWELKQKKWVLKMDVRKDTNMPVRITYNRKYKSELAVKYLEYITGLPLDRSLFVPPVGIKYGD